MDFTQELQTLILNWQFVLGFFFGAVVASLLSKCHH